MLALGPRNQGRITAQPLEQENILGSSGAGFDCKYRRMNGRSPQRASLGNAAARMLESDQSEALGGRLLEPKKLRLRGARGGKILGIAAEPFPSEQRPVRTEQCRISGGITPVEP